MNSLERVKAAVHFQASDRTPVIPQLFGHAAVIAGKTVDDYVRDGSVLADCQLRALERYDHDAVFAVMDVNVETEALGSVLTYRPPDYPYVRTHAFTRETNLQSIALPDPAKAGRMPEMLRALQILRRELQEEVPVIGCVIGPMTLATQLLGMETALYLSVDDCEAFERLLDFSTRVAIRYGVAQIEAGAHLPIVFDPGASRAVVPSAFFKELLLPRLKQLFSALDTAGAAAGWLHVAGPNTSMLPLLLETGASLIDFDYCVEPEAIVDSTPHRCWNGNIKSLDFEEAEPESIYDEALRLVDLFAARGGFVLSSGCEISPRARPENVDALVAAARARR